MLLLTPLALLLLTLAVPIILMYILKLRRQEQVVPSTVLWQRVLEDVQANAPWQRLRVNLLLLLQLLALVALVLALARPAYSRSHVFAGDVIVIVDQSYGMQARDVAPSRFDNAAQRVHQLVTQLGGDSVMSVIGMGAQPHLAIADSSDSGAVDRSADSLRVGNTQPNFLASLSLAASLARAGHQGRIIVLTSRDSGISSLPLPVTVPVDIVRVGGALHDLGITTFSAAQRASAVEAVARVSNFGSGPARSDLDLLVDGQVADVRPLTVAPHAQQNLFWSDIPAAARSLQVRLTARDDVTADKSAWAVVPSPASRRILLVSHGDYFLETALVLDPSVKLSAVAPSNYQPGLDSSYDLTIFDGSLPPTAPTGSALLVNPPVGTAGDLRFGREVTAGGVTVVPAGTSGPSSSILRYVDLGDVHVAATRVIPLPGWLHPLAQTAGGTALAAGERSGHRIGLVNFDLQRSDWPLRISFPVALHNLLDYLAPGLTLGNTNLTTGQAATFFPPPRTQELQVQGPSGGTTTLRPPFAPFAATDQPGVYTVRAVRPQGTSNASFAVNFFPSRPAPAGGPSTLHLGQAGSGKATSASIPIDMAWTVCILALVVLGAEWWVAFRGSGAA